MVDDKLANERALLNLPISVDFEPPEQTAELKESIKRPKSARVSIPPNGRLPRHLRPQLAAVNEQAHISLISKLTAEPVKDESKKYMNRAELNSVQIMEKHPDLQVKNAPELKREKSSTLVSIHI